VRRKLYWVGVLAGVLLLAAGAVVAALGLTTTASPASVVRGYFAALAHGDAAEALAYGTVPRGPHSLLTSDVLREQQRIAPLHDVTVSNPRVHGAHATVTARYHLAFPGADVAATVDVRLHKISGKWRLDAVAVATRLATPVARQRESVIGAPVPRGRILLFPGALPVRLDTPYLALDPSVDKVWFNSPQSTDVDLKVTAAGRAALRHEIRARLRGCLDGSGSMACPLPNERYVPGSISGMVKGTLRASLIAVESYNPVGVLLFDGHATVVGRYRRLNFHNRQIAGHGRIELDVHAVAYAVTPLRLRWVAS